jgi:hypothetical protein
VVVLSFVDMSMQVEDSVNMEGVAPDLVVGVEAIALAWIVAKMSDDLVVISVAVQLVFVTVLMHFSPSIAPDGIHGTINGSPGGSIVCLVRPLIVYHIPAKN